MMPKINLRSDTVTLPSKEMREILSQAKVGDDAYGEDPSIRQLQNYCCELFQVEAALFVASGVSANRLAILSQTDPGDEVVTEYGYHIHLLDGGAVTSTSGVIFNPCITKNGILSCDAVTKGIQSKPRSPYYAQPKLISIENTINGHQGKIFPFNEIKKLRELTYQNGLKIHLDGARLFNAHVVTGQKLSSFSEQVDSLSVCFSKGLGAPFGSMLMGSQELIEKAKRFKHIFGNTFHQIGFQARAALFALENNINQLSMDHKRAKYLAQSLSGVSELGVDSSACETNIVNFSVSKLGVTSEEFVVLCEQEGVLLFPWLPQIVRAVTHRDINDSMIEEAATCIRKNALKILNSQTVKEA